MCNLVTLLKSLPYANPQILIGRNLIFSQEFQIQPQPVHLNLYTEQTYILHFLDLKRLGYNSESTFFVFSHGHSE